MKKSEQIKALKLECDRLAAERDQMARCLSAERAKVQRLMEFRAVPSLPEQVRRQFRSWRDGLLEAVGL